MNKYFIFLSIVFLLVLYFLWGIGQSRQAVKAECEKEIIIKEVEVIKYVQKEKAKIYARPHAGRSDLLRLMHENKL